MVCPYDACRMNCLSGNWYAKWIGEVLRDVCLNECKLGIMVSREVESYI